MADSWRLFIAFELPEHILELMQAVQADLQKVMPRSAMRWVRPEGIHLTLVFLGDVGPDRIPTLTKTMAEVAARHHPMSLGIEGLGVFPNLRRPSVLWLGVKGDLKPLAAAQDDLADELVPLGFKKETRPYRPHLTVARIKREASRADQENVGKLVDRANLRVDGHWQVRAMSLMRSQFEPGGSIYTQVAELPLAQSSD
ncbi:MAG: RNA 2',3'-cyclic phosphodiesterase [Chloroflexi bacterium]|nr:RNA 2',3'-cyclic phosphodiesterase [Chloroflexota bacterium]